MRFLAIAGVIFFGFVHGVQATEVTLSFEPGPKPVNYAGANPWNPTGAGERTPSHECQASVLEEDLVGAKDANDQSAVLRDFFTRCEAKLARYGLHHMLSLAKLGRAQYRFLENPNIREVKFTLTDRFSDGRVQQEVIRGLVARKPDGIRRPWLLIKCGLFCSVSNSTLFRNLLMHGFDESPFNMIVLNGNTGSEFLLDNHHLSLGGFDEGKQAIEIARFLRRESIFKEEISSLHLMGVSKGGHAALYASAYNQAYALPDGSKPLASVAALCPVVDLRASIHYLFERSAARQNFYREFVELLREVSPVVPILQQLVDLNNPPPPAGVAPLVAEASLDYYSQLPREWALPPFLNAEIRSVDALWAINNLAAFPESITTPTLLWAPRNDNIVNYDENAALLEPHAGGKANPNLFLLPTPHGNHCGFSLAYGWDTLSAILRAHVLAHSPEFVAARELRTEPVIIGTPELEINERHISQEWTAFPNQDSLQLSFKVWKGGTNPTPAIRCDGDPFEADLLCYEKRTLRIPYSALTALNLQIPNSETKAWVLTRWLNATLTLLDAEKQKLTNSRAAPAFLRWASYRSAATK